MLHGLQIRAIGVLDGEAQCDETAGECGYVFISVLFGEKEPKRDARASCPPIITSLAK